MGYYGKTFGISCSPGGLNGNNNLDAVDPAMMLHPTRNLSLTEGGRRKRGGTAYVNDAAFTATPQIMGIYDFRLRNATQFIITACKNGKIYKDDTTTIDTGMDTTNWFSFETFENELYICDGVTRPQTWDGAAAGTSDITSIPTDWSGSSFPQQLIKHGRGVSERLWAIGCPSTPHIVYASANADGQDFSDENVTTVAIETGDGFGIVGGVEFGDRLMCFGKRKTYIIDDADSDTATWGYGAAQWEGGAAHWRLIIKTPTDLVAMQEDGEIYSVRAAQEYGDYKMASLTRKSFMHNWIKEYLRLGYISHFHGVYDPAIRAVKIFCVRAGQTTVDTALVYYIDRGPEHGWMIHDNQTSNSGYSASAAGVVRVSAGSYKVYTGDYGGNVWKLEEENRNDNDNGYYAGFLMPNMSAGDSRGLKNFKRGWLSTRPKGDWDMSIKWWVDGVSQTSQSVSLAGAGALLDSFTLDTDVLGGEEIIETEFQLGESGKRIQAEIYNSGANEDFFISGVMFDYKPLGRKPAE